MMISNCFSKFDSSVFSSGQRGPAFVRSLLVALFIQVTLSQVTLSLPASATEDRKVDPSVIEFFENQVRPLLVKQCISCHGEGQQFSSLRVDSREALLKGGNRGPAIIPGDATLSLLAKAVRHEGLKMPMGSKLTPEEIGAIEKWINLGAPWPSANVASAASAPGFYEKIKKEHWAFQPLAYDRPALSGNRSPLSTDRPVARPPLDKGGLQGGFVQPTKNVPHPVDQFIRTSLAKAGLRPTEPADRQTLIRRLSLVLT